jgi:hypothetical protein
MKTHRTRVLGKFVQGGIITGLLKGFAFFRILGT